MPVGCFALFISLFYLFGFGVLGYGLWSAWWSTRAGSWPTAPATITKLSLDKDHNSDGDTSCVKVRYTYCVDGVAYEGDRVAFGYVGSNLGPHDKLYQKLKSA